LTALTGVALRGRSTGTDFVKSLGHIRRHCVAIALALLALCGAMVSVAAPGVAMVTTQDLPSESLAGRALTLQETSFTATRGDRPEPPWTLGQAVAAFDGGEGRSNREPVLNLGIGRAPVWLLLNVMNPESMPVRLNVVVGQSWLDEVDLHVIAADGARRQWRSGDALAHAPYRDEGLGYVFPVDFGPGHNRVLVRVATPEAMLVSLRLMDERLFMRIKGADQLTYGLVTGFLFSLLAYNLLLYPALRRTTHLSYAAYLLCFLALNLAYTGRGATWLWGNLPWFQRYAMDIAAVLFASAGLLFAERFLELAEYAPRLARWVRAVAWLVPLLLLFPMVASEATAAAVLTMWVLWLHLLVMLALGLYALSIGRMASGYFTLAMVSAVGSVGVTQVAVLGWVPLNEASFRILEAGMAVCAAVLALALAQFVRHQVDQRLDAERQARSDPLTGLANRRGFQEQSEVPLQLALRHRRPLSVLLLDVDHFRRVNEQYGHAIGDKVLQELAQFLTWAARRADIVARWGGEEFVMLLPETSGAEATSLAERVRATIHELSISCGEVDVRITVCLGAAQLLPGQNLEQTLVAADEALGRAKRLGRNRVVQGPSIA
jgi:diguanylate cyclase (GGDEF)-like protein